MKTNPGDLDPSASDFIQEIWYYPGKRNFHRICLSIFSFPNSLLAFFFCLLTFHSPAQQFAWQNISSNLPKFSHDTVIINGGADTIIASISGLSFIDDSHGWICTNHPFNGESSAVLETTDGGINWTVHDAPLAAADIYMVDENTGYLGATNGMIYRTTDGCQTWNYHGHLLSYLYDLEFPPRPAQNGYAGGKNGKMAQITPEGVFPFDLDLAGNVYCIEFPSVERGYALLDYQMIIYFMDGEWHVEASYPYAGKTWMFFLNNDLGWCVGDRFLKTEVGIDWYTTSASTVLDGVLTGVFFNNENLGWAVGSVGQIFYTSNGGDEWIRLEQELTDGFLNGVCFTSPNHGFIYGGEKILLKYGSMSGLNESPSGEISISPNPSDGRVTAVTKFKKCIGAEVLDLSGKLLLSIPVEESATSSLNLDFSVLPTGLYLLRLKSPLQSCMSKIIKQ